MSKSQYENAVYPLVIDDEVIHDLFLTNKYFKCSFNRYAYNRTLYAYHLKRVENRYSKEVYAYVCNRYDYITDFTTALARLLFFPDKHPVCITCGKLLKLDMIAHVSTHCSCKCAQLDPNVSDKIVKAYKKTYYDNKKQIVAKKRKNSLERWGVEYPSQSTIIKERKRDTCLKNWNAESYWKSEASRQHNSNIANIVTEKRFATYKKNNSFKSSRAENIVFEIIKSRYSDVIRQYKSDVYPFNCDFYIPSLDLYIEYQGSEMHNDHAYNKDDMYDAQIVEEWKRKSVERHAITGKSKSRYDMMIYTWTDLDVRKRQIAQQNNLNYLELWNLTDIFNKILDKSNWTFEFNRG